MSIGTIQCGAIAALQPGFPTLMSKIVSCDPAAVQQNADAQITVVARAGEVGKQLEGSMKQLETLWKAGAAVAGAVSAFNQLRSAFDDLVGQGTQLGERIQAIGRILQNTIRIVQFVKAANAAVAALMSNPFSMSAARALAGATTVQTASWLGMLAQAIMTIGTVISAIQQAVQQTESTTAEVGKALDPGMASPIPAAPPATGQPALPQLPIQPLPVGDPIPLPRHPAPYPSYGSYPPAAPPPGTPSTPPPVPQPMPLPAPLGPVTGVPNVYNSGWIPRNAGGSGDRITISLEDLDGDGKYNVKVDAEGDLDRDLKIGGRIGDQEFNVDIDSSEA
ncbi:MAG TPA: hypothetical protein VIL37_14265 [Natronosporangium sp.]